jgi:hypothetical protein
MLHEKRLLSKTRKHDTRFTPPRTVSARLSRKGKAGYTTYQGYIGLVSKSPLCRSGRWEVFPDVRLEVTNQEVVAIDETDVEYDVRAKQIDRWVLFHLMSSHSTFGQAMEEGTGSEVEGATQALSTIASCRTVRRLLRIEIACRARWGERNE